MQEQTQGLPPLPPPAINHVAVVLPAGLHELGVHCSPEDLAAVLHKLGLHEDGLTLEDT